jgi:putative addiction module killer protein
MIIEYYETPNGKQPFKKWIDSKNAVTQEKINFKLILLEEGFFSKCKPLGDGVFERKMHSIRIYFLKYKDTIIVLLLGGEKDKQQQRDIDKARRYAKDYLNRHKD